MIIQKTKAFIRLIRPDLSLAAGICVVAGQILAAGKLPPLAVGLLGFITGFALSGSAIILNDYFDYEVDLINAPERPLPSGAVSRVEALWFTVVVTLAGLAAAWSLGMNALVVSIIFWIIGFLYNWRYKQSGLIGNLMVCASVGITFILGAMTVHDPWNRIVWTFSLIAFFFDLGEEIAGDAMDMEGDKKRGSRSIALLKGQTLCIEDHDGVLGIGHFDRLDTGHSRVAGGDLPDLHPVHGCADRIFRSAVMEVSGSCQRSQSHADGVYRINPRDRRIPGGADS